MIAKVPAIVLAADTNRNRNTPARTWPRAQGQATGDGRVCDREWAGRGLTAEDRPEEPDALGTPFAVGDHGGAAGLVLSDGSEDRR